MSLQVSSRLLCSYGTKPVSTSYVPGFPSEAAGVLSLGRTTYHRSGVFGEGMGFATTVPPKPPGDAQPEFVIVNARRIEGEYFVLIQSCVGRTPSMVPRVKYSTVSSPRTRYVYCP